MKLLLFHLGADRYGLPLQALQRVLPLLALKALPLAPAGVAGLMDYHGQPVPVIDLNLLAGLAPCAAHCNSRIMLVDYRAPDGSIHLLGLCAERVLGIVTAGAPWQPSGVPGAPFLGPVAADASGIVQQVLPEQLLPPALRAQLFAALEAAP